MVDILNTNNRHTLYINKCIQFAETIVIKLDDVADLMNYLVVSKLGVNSVDLTDKSTWKYYQNIAGNYHISDTVMKVNSLDVDGEIEFTKDNLNINRNTKTAYAFGSRYYTELVTKYPDQELLILGILYPTDINKAINAKNGEILNYIPSLVEDNEYSLIKDLQEVINKFLFRWVNRQYMLSDDLYVATYVGQLTLHVLQAIISIRLAKCKTNEAHSYHVRQYLTSHGFKDFHLDVMTKEQLLSFYRNILYIERNAGKNDTLELIIDKTMTIRNLPIYEINAKHDISKLNDTTSLSMEDSQSFSLAINRQITPEPIFRRNGLNSLTENVTLPDYQLNTLLNKIVPLANDNQEYQTENLTEIDNKLTYSDSSVLSTKLLESVVSDKTNSAIYPLQDILYNHWIYLTAKQKYISFTFLDLPVTNTSIRLTAQQTVGLYMYLSTRLYSSHLTNNEILELDIPKFKVERVVRIPVPTISELTSIVDIKKLTEEEILEIHNTTIQVNDFTSVQEFKDLCINIFNKAQLQYEIFTRKEDKDARGYAQNIVSRLYTDEVVVLNELVKTNNQVMKYKDLLSAINIDLSTYTNDDITNLMKLILSKTLLEDNNPNTSASVVLDTMVSLLMKLSSYSINVLKDINNLPIVIAPLQIMRISLSKIVELTNGYILDNNIRMSELSVIQKQKYLLDTNDLLDFGNVTFTELDKLDLTDFLNVRITKNGIDKLTSIEHTLGINHISDLSIGNFNSIPELNRESIFNTLRNINELDVNNLPVNNNWL